MGLSAIMHRSLGLEEHLAQDKMPRHKKKRLGDNLDPSYGLNPWGMYGNPFMAAAMRGMGDLIANMMG